MSADNGIYILKLKDQYRIIHAQAIDNLYWAYNENPELNGTGKDLVYTRVFEYFHDAFIEKNEGEAFEMASYIYDKISKDDFGVIEYGIQKIDMGDISWSGLIKQANEDIQNEIENVTNYKQEQFSWKHEYFQSYKDDILEELNNKKNLLNAVLV